MTPAEAEKMDKLELLAKINGLEAENRKLKDKLVELMMRSDPVVSAS